MALIGCLTVFAATWASTPSGDRMVGRHGVLTDAERLIPLLVAD